MLLIAQRLQLPFQINPEDNFYENNALIPASLSPEPTNGACRRELTAKGRKQNLVETTKARADVGKHCLATHSVKIKSDADVIPCFGNHVIECYCQGVVRPRCYGSVTTLYLIFYVAIYCIGSISFRT